MIRDSHILAQLGSIARHPARVRRQSAKGRTHLGDHAPPLSQSRSPAAGEADRALRQYLHHMSVKDRTESVDRARLLRTFLDLVAIDSPTGHEEEIGKDLEARFGVLGCAVSRDEIGNVIAVRPARGTARS